MPFKITSKQIDDFSFIKSTGNIIDRKEYIDFARVIYQHISNMGNKTVLLDDSQLSQIKGIMDQVALVQEFSDQHFDGLRGYKIAEIVGPDDYEAAKFFETFNLNLGYGIKVFISESEARKWLNIA